MSWLFPTAPERARRAWRDATVTKRKLEESALELRQMEYLLKRISHDIPRKTPVNVIKGIQHSISLTERHADRTLKHMRKLKQRRT